MQDESELLPPRPAEPDLPEYVLDPLRRSDAERLREISEYALTLAEWKEQQAEIEELAEDEVRKRVSEYHKQDLRDAGKSASPEEYDSVPVDGRAYVVVKTPRDDPYYYWAWRTESGSWSSKLICRVDEIYSNPEDSPTPESAREGYHLTDESVYSSDLS